MGGDEYYKAIAKAAEDWRRQNIFVFQEIARVAKTVQPAYISTLRDLEKSMVGFRTMQEQIRTLSASIPRIEPALGQSIREANLKMSAVLVSLKPYQDFARRLQEDQRRWAESLKASIEPGPSAPPRIAPTSIVLLASFLIGSITSSTNFCPIPASSKANLDQL